MVPVEKLLTVLVTWLSISSGLPADHDHPEIKLASTAEMTALRLERAHQALERHVDLQIESDPDPAQGTELYAIYDDQTRTIFLSEDWTGATPAESSILVHELVHHLQNAAGLTYACAEGREKPAYQAQERWLEIFDTSLSAEFGLDPMTLLLRTNCMH